MCGYTLNPIINITTITLIILGGIGFVVLFDLIRLRGNKKRKGLKFLSLHSKIALSLTAFLILFGTAFIFIFEYNNPETVGEHSLFQKIQFAIFQSVTTRTAGFATVPQENLTNGSAFVSLILMFIGGSPVGTAGGIKTVTVAVLLFSALATIRNQNETEMFNRTVSKNAVRKAVAVFSMSFIILLCSTLLLSLVCDATAIDILYETVSATATVGLTRSLTPSLNLWGKLIIIATMYFGRVGPISLAFAFSTRKENRNIIKNPTEEISVG